ncbi:MAG: phage structural protein [Lachnospiraceae bacterium]
MGKTYSSKKVTMALGSHIVSGYAEDNFLTISETGDGVTSVCGCDGEVAASISPDPRHTVKISVLQNSPTHKYLTGKYQQMKAGGNGTFAILVKDLTGGDVFSADEAWVVKKPDWVRGKAIGSREWELCAVGEFE